MTPAHLRTFTAGLPSKPETVDEALQLQSGAAMQRAIGRAMIEENGDQSGGRFHLAQAEAMEAAALAFMDVKNHVTGPVRPGNGGEVVVATKEALVRE